MKRLSINLSIGYTLLICIGWLVVMVGGLELLARSSQIKRILPSQGFGSSHRQFEIQLDRLMRRYATEGHIDCLIIGNSHVYRGINPTFIENAVQEKIGKPFVCQNFGLMGTSASLYEQITEVLVKKFSPKLIIVGVSFVDFDSKEGGAGNEKIINSPWFQYQAERKITLDTVAINSLTSYRYYLGWYSAFFYPHAQLGTGEPLENSLPNGFIPNDSVYDFSSKSAIKSINKLDLLQNIHLVQIETSELAAFEKLLSENSNVVVVETPFPPFVYQHSDEAVAKRERFITSISQLSAKYHRPFIPTQNVVSIPETGWYNFQHMNREGADYFSKWLSQEIVTNPIIKQIGE